jgi:hypothetical protein
VQRSRSCRNRWKGHPITGLPIIMPIPAAIPPGQELLVADDVAARSQV